MAEVRTKWTNERLDDFSRRVDERFNRVDAKLDRLEARVDARSAELGARIDAMQRIMIQFGGMTTLGILTTLVTVVLTRA